MRRGNLFVLLMAVVAALAGATARGSPVPTASLTVEGPIMELRADAGGAIMHVGDPSSAEYPYCRDIVVWTAATQQRLVFPGCAA